MRQILCLSADPWRTIPTRTQQLMTRMRDAQVLLFEPPGKYSRQPGRRVRPGLTVCALPPVLEAEDRHRLLFRLHYRRLGKFIRRQMEHHRFKEPLLWCTAPEHIHLLDEVPHRGVVYDCDRDWPDQSPRWESDLALAADVVFAASQGLIDHLSPCNDNIALLPNGVNHPMFTRPPAELPPELRGLSSPILGYTGTLWRDLDLAPVLYAAQAMPACTFVFLGRREKNPMAELLERLPNVRLLGRRAPVEVPTTWPALTCASTCCAAPSRATTWCPAASTNTSPPASPWCPCSFPSRWSTSPTWCTAPTLRRNSPPSAAAPWRRPATGPKTAAGSTGPPPPGRPAPTR